MIIETVITRLELLDRMLPPPVQFDQSFALALGSILTERGFKLRHQRMKLSNYRPVLEGKWRIEQDLVRNGLLVVQEIANA